MGVEQGGFKSESADIIPSSEPIDFRLHRALRVWHTFGQIRGLASNIQELNAFEVVDAGRELADSIYKSIGVDSVADFKSWISARKLEQVTEAVSAQGKRIIFIRHGEQSPPEWIYSIDNLALRKIRMMQNPFNNEDLITNKGLVDAFLTGLAVLYISKKTGRKLRILSSENMRALDVATVMSSLVPDSTCEIRAGLNCITYKDERDVPPVNLEQILEDLPKGSMPWDPELVDKLCKPLKNGKKQSEAIIETIGSICEEASDAADENEVVVVLTHSQQLGEVLRFYDRLDDPDVRFPELSMFVVYKDELGIFPRGVLSERADRQDSGRKPNIRKILEETGDGYDWYRIRREEYDFHEKIPFLISPEPFRLTKEQSGEVEEIGYHVTAFVRAAHELYIQDEAVRELLNRGKPGIFRVPEDPRYLFVRPDLLVTADGFSVCEIETSPFGLALAELLNRAYRKAGFETMVPAGELKSLISSSTPNEGTIVYSRNTSSYAGQLEFLAKEIFSGEGRNWGAERVEFLDAGEEGTFYRGFYLHEYLDDLFVNGFLASHSQSPNRVFPSVSPHLEEKAWLALAWDVRWDSFFREKLGEIGFRHLRKIIPPTWVVGQEGFFGGDFPAGCSTSLDLASIPRPERKFVLKKSGFGHGSSWAEGVSFLHEKKQNDAAAILAAAEKDLSSLYIIQEFRPSVEHRLPYTVRGTHQQAEMAARVRITPYFAIVPGWDGKLIAIKATGCEGTNYIHASTGSINTAVISV